MRPCYRVYGMLLFFGIHFALSAQTSDGSAFLSGTVLFNADSIYPLKPRSVILQKDWPVTFSQFEQEPIDTTSYSFEIALDPEQLTYGSIIINFYRDIDTTAMERQGHWTGSERPDNYTTSDGFVREYVSRIRFSGIRFVIEPGDSLHMVINFNDADSIGRPYVFFSGTGANNNNLRQSMYTVLFDSESFRLPLDEGLNREDELLAVKLEELQMAKDSISEAYYQLLHTDALFDNLGSKHALIRASLYGSDRSIDEKRALARHYYTFLDTLTLKPEYLRSREFRGFLNFYLEYINRIVTGKDVPYDQDEKGSYLAKAIFEDEMLRTFLFERLEDQMNEPGFYKTRASQYAYFREQFPNSPEAYRLSRIHNKRFPVSNGQPAPDLLLIDSLGRHTKLSHLKGKVVLLTTYYPGTRTDSALLKKIVALRGEFKSNELVLVGLRRWEEGSRAFFHPLVDYYVGALDANPNLSSYQFLESYHYTFIIRKNGIIKDFVHWLNISDQTISSLRSEKYTLLTRMNNFGQEHTRGIIIFLSILLSMTLVFFLQSRLKARRQLLMKKQLNSELKAIRSQLNPHFLFNSLNSLQNFINQSNTKTANLHLTKFSRLMRRVIELSEKESVSLQEELELNRTFIELEQLRYGFKCTFDVEERIDLFNVEIPSMIIQPFIENAIVHAMAGMGEKGELQVIVKETGMDKIQVEILDNGKGFRAEAEHGFGLRSSRERIDLMNSQNREKIKLHIESPLDKKAKKGTAVTLIIPKKI